MRIRAWISHNGCHLPDPARRSLIGGYDQPPQAIGGPQGLSVLAIHQQHLFVPKGRVQLGQSGYHSISVRCGYADRCVEIFPPQRFNRIHASRVENCHKIVVLERTGADSLLHPTELNLTPLLVRPHLSTATDVERASENPAKYACLNHALGHPCVLELVIRQEGEGASRHHPTNNAENHERR
jgi:hypothetical protein